MKSKLMMSFLLLGRTVHSFVSLPSFVVGRNAMSHHLAQEYRMSHFPRFVSSSSAAEDHVTTDDDYPDDATLLNEVSLQQLLDLCQQFNIVVDNNNDDDDDNNTITKEDLLRRLRKHANEQAALDKQRKLDRATRVREGVGEVSKERYELVGEDTMNEEDELSSHQSTIDDDGYFYFNLPDINVNASTTKAATNDKNDDSSKSTNTVEDKKNTVKPKKKSSSTTTTRQLLTAPPPPDKPNEKGERVVTVYSSSDTNDLTGAAAAEPGNNGVLMEGERSSEGQPWELGSQQNNQNTKVPVELQQAKETVEELIRSLLLLGGAPAFREEFTEGLQPVENTRLKTVIVPSLEFVGFDPSFVPTEILTASSKSLRAGRGSVLQDVLHDLELRAVGHDGMAGDDIQKGGGHYREVSKVRAFLEGFRRAEVQRIARETTTLLLDKVATDGIQGLDSMLATMSKAQDDSGDTGELSDSLLDFLNDMVREQETRVGESRQSNINRAMKDSTSIEADELDKLWNVTNEDGQRVETLDPQDPLVIKALSEEQAKSSGLSMQKKVTIPSSAPEQLLLLLKLLRDRIKAEAAFGNDNHGRNLRILAYCLRFENDSDREKLLRREFQSSVDRLDEFLELVAMSIEYAESTSAQLQPRSMVLDRKLLGDIHNLARRIRDQTASTGTRVV